MALRKNGSVILVFLHGQCTSFQRHLRRLRKPKAPKNEALKPQGRPLIAKPPTTIVNKGPSIQCLSTLVSKAIPLLGFETRVLKYWVLEPSGKTNKEEHATHERCAVHSEVDQGPANRAQKVQWNPTSPHIGPNSPQQGALGLGGPLNRAPLDLQGYPQTHPSPPQDRQVTHVQVLLVVRGSAQRDEYRFYIKDGHRMLQGL